MPLDASRLAPPQHPLERLPEEWAEVVVGWGEKAFRGKQIFHWIHRKGVFSADAMSNLPKKLREKLAEELDGLALDSAKEHFSSDRTRKLLVRMRDGRDVETVLIPQLERDPDVDEADRSDDLKAGLRSSKVVTQCISSQVGCAMGCVFCASGVAGLQRHLSAAEIVSQVLLGRRCLDDEGDDERLRNVVLMGMGEPLHNYDAVGARSSAPQLPLPGHRRPSTSASRWRTAPAPWPRSQPCSPATAFPWTGCARSITKAPKRR